MFFDANDPEADILGEVPVGSLPDMVTVTPDGAHALVANEGEPADDFSTDPEGSVSVIDLPAEVAAPSDADVHTADFHEFEDDGAKTLPEDVRIFGPTPEEDLPISRNLEPEYITVAGDKAYATLQEANAIAVVDIASASVEEILPLGLKDHGRAGNGLDASDRDPEDAPTVNITAYEGLKGAYMPDTISTFTSGGTDYLVTANEVTPRMGRLRRCGQGQGPRRGRPRAGLRDLAAGGQARRRGPRTTEHHHRSGSERRRRLL